MRKTLLVLAIVANTIFVPCCFADNAPSALESALSRTRNSTVKIYNNDTIDAWTMDFGNRQQAQRLTIKGRNNYIGAENLAGVIINKPDDTGIAPKRAQVLTINNITFSDFKTAFSNYGGTLSLSRVNFRNNTSSETGGAIYSEGFTSFYANTFASDSAKNGGALYLTDTINNSRKTIHNINKSEFYKNTAEENGGAVNIQAGKTIIKNSVFGSPKAYGNNAKIGGAIYNAGSNTQVSSSYFTNNRAEKGGDIYNTGKITINNSTFGKNNNSDKRLWYIMPSETNPEAYNKYNYFNKTYPYNAVNLKGIISDFGSSANQGGAIYNASDMVINSSRFYYAIANQGGAIYNDSDKNLTVNRSTFSQNHAQKLSDEDITSETELNGGAIYNNKGNVVIGKSTFSNNSAQNAGGAIYNADTILSYDRRGNITGGVNSSKFISNTAKTGGAIYNTGNLGASRSTFNNNIAEDGGAFYNTGTLYIFSSAFNADSANQYGGAIYNGSTGNIIINGSTFYQNIADYGGAIYNEGDLTVNKSIFGRSKKRRTVYYNSAQDGSAIFNKGTLTLSGSSVAYNIADNRGALYNLGTANIYSTTFSANNSALGGAINNANTGTVTTDRKTKFTSNIAKSGGAVYNDGDFTANSSNFSSNRATGETKEGETQTFDGGAVYNNGKMSVTTSTFSKNNAKDNGGAVYNAGTYTDTRSSYSYNNATNGGAIYNKSQVNLNGSYFGRNSATKGGAFYNDNGGVLTLAPQKYTVRQRRRDVEKEADNNFYRNSAVEGGAVYNIGTITYASLENAGDFKNITGIFNTNTATMANQTVKIKNSDVGDESKYMEAKGGAIFNYGTVLEDMQIERNGKTCKLGSAVGVTSIGSSQVIYNDGEGTYVYKYSTSGSNYSAGTNMDGKIIYDGHIYDLKDENITSTDYTSTSVLTDNQILYDGKLYDISKAKESAQEYKAASRLASGQFVYNNKIYKYSDCKRIGSYNETSELTDTQVVYNNFIYNFSEVDTSKLTDYETNPTTLENNQIVFDNYIYTLDDEKDYDKTNIASDKILINGKIYTKTKQGDRYIIPTAIAKGQIVTTNNRLYTLEVYKDGENKLVYTEKDKINKDNQIIYNGKVYNFSDVTEIGDYITGKLSLDKATFTGNKASNKVVLKVDEYTDSYKNTVSQTITMYAGKGGAIYNESSAELNISNSTFSKNYAAQAGGAIYNENIKNNLKITNSNFTSNSAKSTTVTDTRTKAENSRRWSKNKRTKSTVGDGGAIYTKGNLYINNKDDNTLLTRFTSNSAVNGGAVYAGRDLEIYNTQFVSNSATSGGAICLAAYSNTDGEDENTSLISASRFERNTASVGGAIYNAGKLSLDGDYFDGNRAVNGGAVYNSGTFNITNSEFKNTKKYTMNYGGYLYNVGDLTSTKTTYTGGRANIGGAVANTSVGSWYYQLRGNLTSKENTYENNQAVYGGAIFNNGESLTSEKDTFNNNTASTGGAVYNGSEATFTDSNFKDNKSAYGGAMFNAGTLNIKGGTYNLNDGYYGGVIFSQGDARTSKDKDGKETTKVTYANVNINGGTFKDNKGRICGGAIMAINSKTTIEDAIFQNNSTSMSGGAIYTVSGNDVLTINGSTFTGNKTDNDGGAIFNSGELRINYKEKSADSDTKATSETGTATETTTETTTDTADDTTKSTGEETGETTPDKPAQESKTTAFESNRGVFGGAICNIKTAYINNAVFKNNIAERMGGAVYNDNKATMDIANSTFTENNAKYGGAIYNEYILTLGEKQEKEIEENGEKKTVITVVGFDKDTQNNIFTSNTATSGGALYNDNNTFISGAQFSQNTAKEHGGAIYSTYNLTLMNTNFDGNSAKYGGAVSIANGSIGGLYTSEFRNNTATYGGAVYIGEKADVTSSNLLFDGNGSNDNKTTRYGGAVYVVRNGKFEISTSGFQNNKANYGGAIYAERDSVVTIIDTDFVNNTATMQGGAIYADRGSDVTVQATARDVLFEGNNAGGKANAIHLNSANLNFDAQNGHKITLKDKVSGIGTITTAGNFTIDKNTQIEAGSNITIKAQSGAVNVNNESSMDNANLQMNGLTKLNIANNKVGTLSLKNLALADNTTTNIAIDADLKAVKVDNITAETREGTGTLNVEKVNLTSNSKKAISLNLGKSVSSVTATTAQTREATYKLKEVVDPETGLIRMVAYGQKAKACTLAAPVAAQLGGYLTQINSYDQAFANMDMDMLKPRAVREADMGLSNPKFANRYASSAYGYTDYTDNGMSYNSKGLWTRPYATFERVNLSGGPKVSNIGYGNFFGGDFGYKQLSNGWSRQLSAYIGYNGSNQDFKGQSIDQNGGTIGITEVWYKNNFFTGLTMNVGANSANASTDLGNENFPMLMAGIASKTGYNFEFKHGRFIIQPSVLLSYSFVHTFSHDNGLGNKVGSSPLHAIQVAPGLKFIWNLKNGWQPYLGVNMRWNIIDKTHFSLRDVSIPDMSIDPYVEYGLGVQRKWGERFTGYGQAMIRNGGRNGVMLSFGFRWAIGK